MTDEIVYLMEELRLVKNSRARYKAINTTIRKEIKQAKQIWFASESEENKKPLDFHDSFSLNEKVKLITEQWRKLPFSNMDTEK